MPAIDVRSAIPRGGFLEAWLDLTEPFEYPESYALFSLLVMASCAVDGRVLINPNHEPSPMTNLFVLLYGPSGFGKSTALWHGVDLLKRAQPEAPLLPENFTMESLIGLLAEKSKEPSHEHPDRMGRAPGLIIAEEMSTLLGGADYRLENSKALSKLYDCRAVMRNLTRAHGDETIKFPYVVLGGCSTPEWIEMLDPRSLSGGLWRRILVVSEWQPKHEAPNPKWDTVKLSYLAEIFSTRFNPARIGSPCMELTPEAHRLNESWYKSTLRGYRNRPSSEREGFYIKSMQTHVYKVGALLHLIEGGDPLVLPASALEAGQKLVETLTPGTFQVYSTLVPTPFARLKATVIRVALSVPEPLDGMGLDRAVGRDCHARPRDITEARCALHNEGALIKRPDERYEVKGAVYKARSA